jgi:hypothetical protein
VFDSEIIQVPTGFLIPTAKYGSFPTTISAVKCIMELVKSVEVGAVSLQLDRNLQPLLDRVWLKKEHLSPICEGDPLIGERNGETCIKPEGIWHFFFSLSTMLIKMEFHVSPVRIVLRNQAKG